MINPFDVGNRKFILSVRVKQSECIAPTASSLLEDIYKFPDRYFTIKVTECVSLFPDEAEYETFANPDFK